MQKEEDQISDSILTDRWSRHPNPKMPKFQKASMRQDEISATSLTILKRWKILLENWSSNVKEN